jgi:HSP20 family protein
MEVLMNRLFPLMIDEMLDSCARGACSPIPVYEDEETVGVEVPLPGIRPENIQVTFEKGLLWISGEAKEEGFRSVKSLSYKIPLGTRVEATSQPEAIARDGILKVIFPKAQAARPLKINVKIA